MSDDREATTLDRITTYGSVVATERGQLNHEQALSFVVCASSDAILKANLLASPCLTGCPHEVIAVCNAHSAADGLSMGIARSSNELIVCVHQDDWLPADWDRLILNQYRMAERQFGPIGVAGVYGVGPVADGSSNSSRDWPHGLTAQRIGWVEDRGRVLSEGPGLPAPVSTLGELLLIIRKKEQKEQDMHRNRDSTMRTSSGRLTRDEWAAASEAQSAVWAHGQAGNPGAHLFFE